MCNKMGQIVLQSRVGITKVGQVLSNWTIITQQGSTIYLATEKFSLKNPEKLNLCYNYTEEEIMRPRVFASFVSLKNNPIRGISFTENCFQQVFDNFVRNYQLRRVTSVTLQVQRCFNQSLQCIFFSCGLYSSQCKLEF